MNNKKSLSHIIAFFLSFLCFIIICLNIFLMMFPKVMDSFQEFTDIIIETTALTGTNKSGELSLFWGILAIGLCLVFICSLFVRKYLLLSENRSVLQQSMKTSTGYFFSHLLILILPNLCHYIFYKKYSIPLILGTILFIFVWIFIKDMYKEILVLAILSYYAVISLASLLCHFSSNIAITSNQLYIITALISSTFVFIYVLFKLHREVILKRCILILQCLLPLLLSVYFIDRYYYRDNMITLRFAPGYYIFFGALLLSCFLIFVIHAQKSWHFVKSLSISKLVCCVSPMLIFVYNSWSACPMFAQPDQHHHGEQMIPWQQIFSLGQSAYEEYSPVSGLFPMAIGGIQNILLGKTASDYSPAVSILMVLCCLITMYLLSKHTNNAWALVFSILFALPSYNRQYLVLPALLLLTLPALIKKRGFWIITYIITSFICGLFYPLFGAAVMLSLIPLCVWQLKNWILSKDWKTDIKNRRFLFYSIPCLIIILLCVPLLLKMLTHTLTYSSQTILADGIALFTQTAPENFLTFVNNMNLRNMCYISIRFFLPMIGIWIFAYMLFVYYRKLHSLFYFAMAAGAICLGIAYTYTLVRADYHMVLSRTAPILISVLGIFLPVMLLSLGKELPFIFKNIIISLCFCIPFLLYSNVNDMKFPNMWAYPNGEADLIMDDGSKLFYAYFVPEILVKSEDLDIPDISKEMLGRGFMVADQSHYLNEYDNVIKKCEAVSDDVSYAYMDGQGFYYYTNTKACGTGFLQAAKGYQAQQSLLTIISKERPVFFSFDSVSNYYIYYWLMTNDYIWNSADNVFYPEEINSLIMEAANVNAEADTHTDFSPNNAFGNNDHILDYYNADSFTGVNLEMAPSSFGNSMDSLKPLFTHSLLLSFSEEAYLGSANIGSESISGIQYDFLEIDIKPAGNAQIPWNESNTRNEAIPSDAIVVVSFEIKEDAGTNTGISNRTCYQTGFYGKNGKLLFPLGMNPNWLLGNISEIHIMILAPGTSLDEIPGEGDYEFTVANSKLLKLRQ